MPKGKDKKKRLKATLISVASVFAGIVISLLAYILVASPKDLPTYSVSGYVYADGEILSGAKVSCGIMSTETDESGFYKFDGLTKVVEISVAKDNYLFNGDLIFVNKDSEDVNFSGFELFSLNGVVKNGDECVPFAQIQAVSEAGQYNTVANAFGEFSLKGMAGQVTLTASHDDVDLFSQTFDKTKTNLVVTGTTSVTGNIVCDSIDEHDFVLRLNGQEIELEDDLSFSLSDVSANSVLTVESENYYVENGERIVSALNGIFQFTAEKYYNIQGRALSGSTPLANARVVVGGTKTYSNSSGEFELTKQHGTATVVTTLQGYTFENVSADYSNCMFNVIGKFNLRGKVITDDNNAGGIEVACGGNRTTTKQNGEFALSNVQLGDAISVVSSDYYVESNNRVLTRTSSVTFNLQKLYYLTINVNYDDAPLAGVTAILNSRSYTSDAEGKIIVPGLHGKNNVSISLDGYKFEDSYSSDYAHPVVNIEPYKYFNLSGKVLSGDLPLDGATITVGGNEVATDESGLFEIKNIYGEGSVDVTCDGYNNYTTHYSVDNSVLLINLTYDIAGTITCGDKVVDNVKVSLNGNSVLSNPLGKFSFANVSGVNTLTFEKDYYSFSSVEVENGNPINVTSTYSITGKVTNKAGAISGLAIKLISNGETTETISTTTGEDGVFNFANLAGQYLLIYDMEYDENLLPSGYTIDCGGIYNFSDCGYKIKGRVMTGDIPVADVQVQAGDLTATTNANGYYKFDLIIHDEVLILSKEGYTFTNNNLPVDMTFDGREDVDFNCTYAIEGVVASGDAKLQGVKVSAGGQEYYTDENGRYVLNGLSGKVELVAEFGNYYFGMDSEITSAGVYNISAMFETSVKVMTGDIAVSDARVSINGGNFVTGSDGEVVVRNLKIGDTIEFVKDGYDIQSYTFLQRQDSISLSATYSVSGHVYLTTNAFQGVCVTCGEKVAATDSNGYFSFDGLEGKATITFAKEEYAFDEVEVSGAQSISARAKFTVSGSVFVAGAGLEGVAITAGSITVYTNEEGNYTISNLVDETVLTVEKTGYEFIGEYIANSSTIIDITASYRIAGKVVSGDIEIEGATVMLSNGETVTTDGNGCFTFSEIEEVVSLDVTASDYHSGRIEGIDKFNDNIVVDLKYSVTIQLTNVTYDDGQTVSVGDVSQNYTGNEIKLENLSGRIRITLSKEGYSFSPSPVVVEKNTTLTITVKKEFKVTGTITTTSGLPASNVTITAGGKETMTDANGYYELTPFTDAVQIKLIMKATDSAFKGESYEYTVNIDQVNTDAVRNFSISDSEYAYYIFKKGYQNLNDAKTYQIMGTGTVVDSASNETQYLNIVYKKDSKNHRILQNLNWHNGKILGIVEPRIVQLSYVDLQNKTIQYQFVKGEDVERGTANWKTTWESSDNYENYLNTYGVNPEGYYPYVINKNTISTTSSLALNNGLYTFTFELAMTQEMYNYYVIQMKNMCSSQSFESFAYCKITYTIGQDGYIRTMDIDEKYNVKASIFNATVVNLINYTFHTTSANEMINDIKIGTVDEIKASLALETPTTTYSSMAAYAVDPDSEKRRKML